MTSFIARHGDRAADSSAVRRPFTRSLVSVGSIVLDAIAAARAIESAHTPADRQAVLDRFAAETTRDASRSAA